MTPSSNKPAHHYQRFIPKEEVQQAVAWQFTAMDQRAPEPLPEPEVAEAAPEEVPEELRQRVYAEGFEHGRLAGAEEARQTLEAPLQQQLDDEAQRLATLFHQAQAELAQLDDRLALQVLELACDLARQVVRRELAQPLEPLKAVVQEALALAVQDGRPATLRLHPDDLAILQERLSDTLQAQQIKLVADASLTPGGCIVEAAQGNVDATVERRWQRAVANLGLGATWNPAEQADV